MREGQNPTKPEEKLAGVALDPKPSKPSIVRFLVAALKLMSGQLSKIVFTLNEIFFVTIVDTEVELSIVSPEILKLASLLATDGIVPRLVMAKGISVQHGQVVMVTFVIMDGVQDHQIAVVEGFWHMLSCWETILG